MVSLPFKIQRVRSRVGEEEEGDNRSQPLAHLDCRDLDPAELWREYLPDRSEARVTSARRCDVAESPPSGPMPRSGDIQKVEIRPRCSPCEVVSIPACMSKRLTKLVVSTWWEELHYPNATVLDGLTLRKEHVLHPVITRLNSVPIMLIERMEVVQPTQEEHLYPPRKAHAMLAPQNPLQKAVGKVVPTPRIADFRNFCGHTRDSFAYLAKVNP